MSQIDNNPPGLVHRRAFRDGGKVIVQEEWNIDVPGCPLIRSPWNPPPENYGSIWIRQIVMSEDEFEIEGPHLGFPTLA